MLIIEILLTIFAWRNGWKWLSVLPILCVILIGFFIGIVVGASGGDIMVAKDLVVFLDIIVIVCLIILVVKKPKSINNTDKTSKI